MSEADHIVPLRQGGDHQPQNLRTLCQSCHKATTKELAGFRSKKISKEPQ